MLFSINYTKPHEYILLSELLINLVNILKLCQHNVKAIKGSKLEKTLQGLAQSHLSTVCQSPRLNYIPLHSTAT